MLEPGVSVRNTALATAKLASRSTHVDAADEAWRWCRYVVEGLPEEQRAAFAALVHDRMTEEVFTEPLQSFQVRCPPPLSCLLRLLF